MTTTPNSERDITRYIIIAIALAAIAAILWRVRQALVIGFGAIVFATAVRAVAEAVRRRTGWSQRPSVAAAVSSLVVVFGLLGWLFGSQTAEQFADLQTQLPEALEKFQRWVASSPLGHSIIEAFKHVGGEGGAGANINKVMAAILGGLGHLLIIVFAGIYFALDPVLYREGALRLLPPVRRPQVRRALNDAGTALHKWLVAQLIVMVCVGVLSGIGLALIGVPLALSLGILVGILEFVPVIGPIAAAVPGVLLAFAKGPETAVYAVLIYIAVQQAETNLLTPLVQRWAVKLPPVLALLSIVACGLVFGVLGVLFATPLAVVAMALVQHLYVEDTLENGHKTRGPTRAEKPG